MWPMNGLTTLPLSELLALFPLFFSTCFENRVAAGTNCLRKVDLSAVYGHRHLHLPPGITFRHVESVFSLVAGTRMLEVARLNKQQWSSWICSIFSSSLCEGSSLLFPTGMCLALGDLLVEVSVAGPSRLCCSSLCETLSPCRIRAATHVPSVSDETRRYSVPSMRL